MMITLIYFGMLFFISNDLHFDFMTPYVKDISDNRINMIISVFLLAIIDLLTRFFSWYKDNIIKHFKYSIGVQ